MDAKQKREAGKAGRRAALVEAFPGDTVEGPDARAFLAAWEASGPGPEERAEMERVREVERVRLHVPLDLTPCFVGSLSRRG